MTVPKTRKQVRFEALHKYFREKHVGKEPEDAYDAYILQMLVNLGELYDDNQDKIRAAIREGKAVNAKRLATLWSREEHLNAIGNVLRRAVNMYIPMPKEGVKRGLKTKLARTPSQDELDLLDDLQKEE